MTAARGATDAPNDAPLSITELLSYRVARVAGLMSSTAATQYRQEFDVSLGEWRALALIADDPTVTVNKLARRAGFDKAQMSRILNRLDERGLLTRAPGAGRSVHLDLTEEGADLYRGLIGAANKRERDFRSCLTAKESRALDQILAKLDTHAREMWQAMA